MPGGIAVSSRRHSFTPGTSFGSTNDLFSYAIEVYFGGTGSEYRTVDAVEYVQTSLDSCAVGNGG